MQAVIEIIDRHGRRRKLRPGEIPADGETVHIPVTLMDHAGFHPYFSDGSPDHTSPFRPGFRFADTNDAARIAADEAYTERSRRMETAWQRKGKQEHDEAHDQRSVRAASLDELQAKAQQAWEDRNVRLSNAWRTNKEA